MIIAVACDGLELSRNAVHSSSFMCYSVDRGVITGCRNIPNVSITSHEAATMVRDLGSDTLIAGPIDMDMAEELCGAGIEVVAGVKGEVREAVENYLSDTLMGADRLCKASCGESDPEEEDIDEAFDRIYKELEAAL